MVSSKTYQRLLIEQLDRRMKKLALIEPSDIPPRGWIHSIRTALKMSMRQLGERMGKSIPTVNDLERAEASGVITLKSLREAARALNMKFIYGFVPQDGSLEKMIEERAFMLARDIVMRTSQNMKLEDQENASERIEKSIQARADELKKEMPKFLWD